MGDDAVNQNVNKLSRMVAYYAKDNPGLARFYMNITEKTKIISRDLPQTPRHVCCQYCLTLFRPDNHTVTVLPKMVVNKKIRQLQNKWFGGKKLGKFQWKLLRTYRESSNRLALLCKTCNKRTLISCQSRHDKQATKKKSKKQPDEVLSKVSERIRKKRLRRQARAQEEAKMRQLYHRKSGSLNTSETTSESDQTMTPKVPSPFVGHPNPFVGPSSSTPRPTTPSHLSFNIISYGMNTPGGGGVNHKAQSDSSKRNKKDKAGKSHNVLQKMLAAQKEKTGKSSLDLRDFLSSVK